VSEGSRHTAEGDTLQWRCAGFEQAAVEPYVPFFIEWAPGTRLPGDGSASGLQKLELRRDPDRLRDWLGEHRLPIEINPGDPAVVGFELA
jgi:hypothetical protein